MNILAIGAHPDDIELGCGATLLRHRQLGHKVSLLVLTTGEQGPQAGSSRVREQEDAAALLGAELYWGGFDDGAVPDGRAAVEVIETVIGLTGADTLYTHARQDTHQDHRAAALASLAAGRRLSRILSYESPTSYDFRPTLYVDVAGLVAAKLDVLRAHFSQVLKNGLVDLEAVEAQVRHHGFAARIRYAEAFQAERYLCTLPAAATSGPELDLVAAQSAP